MTATAPAATAIETAIGETVIVEIATVTATCDATGPAIRAATDARAATIRATIAMRAQRVDLRTRASPSAMRAGSATSRLGKITRLAKINRLDKITHRATLLRHLPMKPSVLRTTGVSVVIATSEAAAAAAAGGAAGARAAKAPQTVDRPTRPVDRPTRRSHQARPREASPEVAANLRRRRRPPSNARPLNRCASRHR